MKSIFYISEQPVSFERVTTFIQKEREKNPLIDRTMALNLVKSKYIGKKIILDSGLIGLFLILFLVCLNILKAKEMNLSIFFICLLLMFAFLLGVYVQRNFNKNVDCKYSMSYLKKELAKNVEKEQNLDQNISDSAIENDSLFHLKNYYDKISHDFGKRTNDGLGLDSRGIAICYLIDNFTNFKDRENELGYLLSALTRQKYDQIYGKVTSKFRQMKKEISLNENHKTEIECLFRKAKKQMKIALASLENDEQNFINKIQNK